MDTATREDFFSRITQYIIDMDLDKQMGVVSVINPSKLSILSPMEFEFLKK